MYPLLSYKMNILHFMNGKGYDYDTSPLNFTAVTSKI